MIIAELISGDFEENTITFEVKGEMVLQAGEYRILKKNELMVSNLPEFENLNLKEARKRKNLTLRQVEIKTGISNAYLSQLESGKIKKPSYETIRTLLKLYSSNSNI